MSKEVNKGKEVKELKDKLVENRKRRVRQAYDSDYYAKMIREAQGDTAETRGWSKSKTRKWIGRIPGEVWYYAIQQHSEQELLSDDKLFKKWFAPFLIN